MTDPQRDRTGHRHIDPRAEEIQLTDRVSEREEELDRVLIGGREPVTVRILDDDGGRLERFLVLEQRIRDAVGSRALSVEHIGSTAVAGLAAKPIIDVLLVVEEVTDEDAYVPALERAGFVLRVREDRHRMFRTPERDTHIHVYSAGSTEIADYLDLRDHLRTDAPDRELYAATKRALAAQPWTDMNHYADAKSDVVHQLLQRARSSPSS